MMLGAVLKRQWLQYALLALVFTGAVIYLVVAVLFQRTVPNDFVLRGSQPLIVDKLATMSPPLRKLPPEDHQPDRWIVVTSVSNPTDDVMFLASIPGWKVVVVGDVKTPSNWSYPNCEFLSISRQEELGFRITAELPYHHYARKNVGYLYAISQGAKFIYETDDDNRPLDKLSSFQLQPTTPGLMFAGLDLFNPYHHFGQSTLWPRGFPLRAIGDSPQRLYKFSENWDTPVIQQGIVNGDPDMDAIFRLTRKSASVALNVTFDPVAPPAFVPEGVFSPFNSQNTFFHYSALWALLIPTTTTFRMCDIWRGYWAQRLLWEIGGRLGFVTSNAFQRRNAHSYMADAEQERSMYFQTDQLLNFLANWTCPDHLSFFDCVLRLTSDMADNDFWKQEEVLVTKLWLEDLIGIGYPEPTRSKIRMNKDSSCCTCESCLPWRQQASSLTQSSCLLCTKWATTVSSGFNVEFYPNEQDAPFMIKSDRSKSGPALHYTQALISVCPEITVFNPDERKLNMEVLNFFRDILLIVVFNFPHYKNVRWLHVTYKSLFPNIVYCGDNIRKFTNSTGDLKENFTFLEAPVYRGYHGYICTLAAMGMGYNVSGYLIVGDDVLMNPWSFPTFNKSRIWVTKSDYMSFDITKGIACFWWSGKFGKVPYLRTLQELKITTEVPRGIKTVTSFLKMMEDNTGGHMGAIKGISDIYFVPKRLRLSAMWYLLKFLKNQVFLEYAVPNVLYGLEPAEEILSITGKSIWGSARKLDLWTFFNREEHYMHPLKLSNASVLSNYCNIYLRTLLANVFGQNSTTSVTGNIIIR